MYLDEDVTQGDLLSFVLYAIYVAHAIGAFSAAAGEFLRAVGASERIFQLLDRKPEINIVGGEKIEKLEGEIIFKSICIFSSL